MADLEGILGSIGSAVVASGRYLGGAIARAYRAIDPDVLRHLSQVPLLTYSLFAAKEAPVEAGEPDGHRPVIFVHGLGGSRGDFFPMALFFRLTGRTRSYKVSLDGGGDIDEMADVLAAFVHAVVEATGTDEVDMVAHSLGGIVARLAITRHGLASRVSTLVTLGTPHGGTYAARLAQTPTILSLRPDSPLVAELSEDGWPRGVRGVTFWSTADLLVIPPESASVEGTEQVDVSPYTHYSYLLEPQSWGLVAEALAPEGAAPPSEG